MKILCTDLDNTLIYSYKHDIGKDKRNVEKYQGRDISFITNMTYELLQKVQNEYLIIPITTRSIEQYNRIDLGLDKIKYALTCNGGILLVNGKIDIAWYNYSRQIVKESIEDINLAMYYLNKDERRKFELRYIEEMFLFTKCDNSLSVVNDLKKVLNKDYVDIYNNGEKVYVVPKKLSKGNAIKRIRKLFEKAYIIAAGDSEFDVSMVNNADKGIVPYGFNDIYNVGNNVQEMPKNIIFSESVLRECLKVQLYKPC